MTACKSFLWSLAVLAATAVAQQPDPVTDFEIAGRVYEPQAVAPTDARIQQLQLPAGFAIHRFADGLENPRMIAVADNGMVFVTQRRADTVVVLRDLDRDGIADVQRPVARIPDVHGIEIRGNTLYLADVKRVYAADINADGTLGPRRVVTANLPDGGQHPNRTLRFGPDGALYVSVGSTCNACIETNPESATLLRVDPASGQRTVFASGLRNTIGFDWHPASQRLFGMDHGIDWLGDDEQTEELNEIVSGARYGWPYVYDDDQLQPWVETEQRTQLEWARLSRSPVGGYVAHAAPMQMQFYRGSMFPAEYRDSAFIAMRGSWNRKPASGYEVVRAMFSATGDFVGFEPFVTGFLQAQPNTSPPWEGAQPKPADGYIGRPTGIAIARDGSLLIGDDSNNVIYRVIHGGSAPTTLPQQLATEILTPRDSTAIRLESSAFAANGRIPSQYTAYGLGTSPPLRWNKLPEGARSFVLIMEDPDATSPLPFVHWIATGPAHITELPADIVGEEWPSEVRGVRQGTNSRSRFGYVGPRPPAGEPEHRYHFQIFALDTTLSLPTGFNRHALLSRMRGHVLAQGTLVGTSSRSP
jgi:Raf kinase inhibitor-like YbhB/YbcL family protein